MVYSRQAMGRRLFFCREMGEGETESAIFYGLGYPRSGAPWPGRLPYAPPSR